MISLYFHLKNSVKLCLVVVLRLKVKSSAHFCK